MPISKQNQDAQALGDELKKAEFAISARRYDLAIQIMQRVLSMQPENSIAFYMIGRAYTISGKPQEAIAAYRESLRLNPEYSMVHALYGTVLNDLEQYQQAEEEMVTALRLDASNDNAHYLYGSFLFNYRKNIEQAKEHLYRALELDPEDARYHWGLGRILAAEGRLDEAEQAYRRALSIHPENDRVHNSYGVLLLNQRHDPRAAFEHFRIGLMYAPNNVELKKNFLVTLKLKHKLYALFWNYSLLRKKLGRAFILLSIVVYLMLRWAFSLVKSIPALVPFALVVTAMLVLFYVYMITINPLFNFLIKRGLIK